LTRCSSNRIFIAQTELHEAAKSRFE